MATKTGIEAILKIYDIGWRLCMPLLRFNHRLKDGLDSRKSANHLQSADVWIQAASAGEAYLSCAILKNLNPAHPVRVLVTTNTRQGMDIINKEIQDISADNHSGISAYSCFFPFDRPSLMEAAVAKINPRVMVLLETEIWPGLLAALKKNGVRILIVNGRLTPKSLRQYIRWQKFLKHLCPDKILAISKADADRFGMLFGKNKVSIMNNIKFDRLNPEILDVNIQLKKLIPETAHFLVYGSIREQEEPLVKNILSDVCKQSPETITGLFPRHMHRIDNWINILNRSGLKWQLRSGLNEKPAEKGTIILWDTFGELNQTYAIATAVFVGGSLAPLGGQNFLEPLIYGIKPVIGPYWDNFAWIGEEIISQGLVIRADNWQSVASELIRQLQSPQSKEIVREEAARYITERSGGTAQACRLIEMELGL